MKVSVVVGDVLDAAADVLVSTANPWLNMSGGVIGAIVARVPEIQTELHSHLKTIGQSAVPASTVVRTSAGTLPFSHIIHAVAIDPFYDSSEEILKQTLIHAFEMAVSVNATSVSLPTLATGYGPMSVESFAKAFSESVDGQFDIEQVTLVVQKSTHAEVINNVLAN